jgi:hypothetical protein
MNCVISSRKEFADGAEFGDMTQILRNLGSCPPHLEFGAICEFTPGRHNIIHD